MTFFYIRRRKSPHKKGGAGEPSRPAGDYEKIYQIVLGSFI